MIQHQSNTQSVTPNLHHASGLNLRAEDCGNLDDAR